MFPRVHVVSTARRHGKLAVLKRMYLEAVERGEHVHWVNSKTTICRNGTRECPFHKEEP